MRDDTLIDDEHFFNVEEMCIKDNRINSSNKNFNIKEDNEIMNLFLNFELVNKMHNLINMQDISNYQGQEAELLQLHHKNLIQVPMQHINIGDVLTM